MKLFPYIKGSAGAKSLATSLEIKRIKQKGKVLKCRKHVIINWGSSNWNRVVQPGQVLNKPINIKNAVNKLQAFKLLDGHTSIPEWTEDAVEASRWLAEGVTVVGRSTLTGHSGQGIVIYDKGDVIDVNIPLFVEYIPKKEEYRLHVFHDNVFFIQRKARNRAIGEVNWKIRNHHNGFIYSHIGVDVPDVCKSEAIMAIKTLGLDFGAVDIIWNEKQNKYYVLEVNCAPGLSGTTLEKYTEVFKEFK